MGSSSSKLKNFHTRNKANKNLDSNKKLSKKEVKYMDKMVAKDAPVGRVDKSGVHQSHLQRKPLKEKHLNANYDNPNVIIPDISNKKSPEPRISSNPNRNMTKNTNNTVMKCVESKPTKLPASCHQAKPSNSNSLLAGSCQRLSLIPYEEPTLSALMWNMFSERRIGNLYKFGDSCENLLNIGKPTKRMYTEHQSYKYRDDASLYKLKIDELKEQQNSFVEAFKTKCEINVRLSKEILSLKNDLRSSIDSIHELETYKELARKYWLDRYDQDRYLLLSSCNTKLEYVHRKACKNTEDAFKERIEKIEGINDFLVSTVNATLDELDTAYKRIRILKNLFDSIRFKFENRKSRDEDLDHIGCLENAIKVKNDIIRKQELTIKKLKDQHKAKILSSKKRYQQQQQRKH